MDSYYSTLETIVVRKDNGVATLTLNRPDSRNAVSPRMHTELSEIWPRVSMDPEIDVVISDRRRQGLLRRRRRQGDGRRRVQASRPQYD